MPNIVDKINVGGQDYELRPPAFTTDTPEENSQQAFSAGGAYNFFKWLQNITMAGQWDLVYSKDQCPFDALTGNPVFTNGMWFIGTGNTASVRGAFWSTNGAVWNKCTGVGDTNCVIYFKGIYISESWENSTDSWSMRWATHPSGTWTAVTLNNPPTSYYIGNTMTANDDIVLAGGQTGIWWSEDGKTWTRATRDGGTSVGGRANRSVFVNGLWVCSADNRILWSEDGKSWTTGASVYASDITYHNGVFFAAAQAYNGTAWWSEDGKNWTACTGGAIMLAVACGNMWVGVLSPQFLVNTLVYSLDGKDWQPVGIPELTNVTGAGNLGLASDGNRAICSSAGAWFESTNGIDWTRHDAPIIEAGLRETAYANHMWLATDGRRVYRLLDWALPLQ